MILKTIIGTAFLLLNVFLVKAQGNPTIKEGAELQLVANGYKFTEGPAADKEGNVYFTDQPDNTILKWTVATDSVTVFMDDAGRANGLYFDKEGNLYACADEKFELWKISPDKEITVVLDNYKGKNLNGPNDLWIDQKGGVYFTDPYYQRTYWTRTEPEMKERRVYYLSPNGKDLKVVADGFVNPNGIIGSYEKNILYISDIGDKKTYVYQVSENGDLKNKELFTSMGSDGMTMDTKGNVYLTGDGVHIFSKTGKLIGHIAVDRDWTSNVTFGGKDFSTLFITASDAIFKIVMSTNGMKR
ncbi:SMP-30/gluconolactonase/LRE family protein [Galbibacter pacificus]|uniref:SMP-30/gluconolactonase/LRE family protein n=1 Tax=Galbibacter pacificus TaxID=2996052 RepID=A0ABT6FNM3_9FLAO|nr:SMP-30/gluconolactonase/LRE family protein [Galbibacter pacificus]MDG3581388.1 SMP-30/gluconolactonase/LRE family protein [Galbibacter pacificus]MDG3584866.1 SMP-30/gluconolactonase/LRE family protein [Galbibacter pacificus]